MTETQAPLVRMDRSRDFATCHGERTPDSEHATLHFIQSGLPFDSEGVLITDHAFFEPDKQNPSKRALMLRERAEKLIQTAAKQSRPRVEGEPETADETADEANGSRGSANLESWARGEARVPWQEVTQAIARRFSVRVANKQGAIELLLKERVVNMAELSDEHRKLVDGD